MDKNEAVEITQADREAAADVWRDYVARTGEIIVERNMRAGGLDEGLPCAFARHRLASQPEGGTVALDGNDSWEALFGIMEGNVPDEMTEEVCQQLAVALQPEKTK